MSRRGPLYIAQRDAAAHLGISDTTLRDLHAFAAVHGMLTGTWQNVVIDARSENGKRHRFRWDRTRVDAWFAEVVSLRATARADRSLPAPPTPKPARPAKARPSTGGGGSLREFAKLLGK